MHLQIIFNTYKQDLALIYKGWYALNPTKPTKLSSIKSHVYFT